MKVGEIAHGESKKRTREYRIWMAMRSRCENINHKAFKEYGGRGIYVCSRWRDYRLFLKDMGRCPQNYTIERIDNDKGYGPDNCKWASWNEQASNKRNSRLINYNGSRKTIAEWARHLEINRDTLEYRMQKGLSFSQAVNKKKFSRMGHGTA